MLSSSALIDSNKSRTRVSRACVPCGRRKVRCNGNQPCQECSHYGISCIFKPRISSATSRAQSKRGVVLSALQVPEPRRTAPSSPPSRCLAVRPVPQISHDGHLFTVNSESLLGLLPDYRDFVFPASPIITEASIRESISRVGSEADHTAFCYAYAAVTLSLTSEKNVHKSPDIIADLVSRALQLRPALGHHKHVTIKRIMTSVFIRISFSYLQNKEMEFYYLREAITMIQMLRVEKREYLDRTNLDDLTLQRLHWLLFINERLFSITDERIALLDPPKEELYIDSTLPDYVQRGFSRAIGLYRLVDDDFLRNWREKHLSPALTIDWIQEKQRALIEQHKLVADACMILSEPQRADLVITGQWLRTLVWQMAVSKYLLQSHAAQDYMLLLFPVQGSLYLQGVLEGMCPESVERQGASILQKLFEITDTAIDVVSLNARLHGRDDIVFWMENCRYLIHYLQRFSNLNKVQKSILQQKQEALDELSTALLENIEEGQ